MPRDLPPGAVQCRSCARWIVYARTESGALAPIDARPATVYVFVEDESPLRGEPRVQRAAADQQIHISHFASCPNAGAWRATGRPG